MVLSVMKRVAIVQFRLACFEAFFCKASFVETLNFLRSGVP